MMGGGALTAMLFELSSTVDVDIGGLSNSLNLLVFVLLANLHEKYEQFSVFRPVIWQLAVDYLSYSIHKEYRVLNNLFPGG